jgi:mannose/cellobiose epimerase-like protein (N-acyl-D-glucosamine 2-epimerase family)
MENSFSVKAKLPLSIFRFHNVESAARGVLPDFHESVARPSILAALASAAAIAAIGVPTLGFAKDLPEHARELKTQLIEKVMPYWYDTTLDKQNGGYVLADDVKGRGTATEKQIVTQSRLVWTFSHAQLKGLNDGKHDYLKAAEHGYRFLLDHFLDKENGGYYWKTDLSGKAINDRKYLYGESFVVYAFVEYYRASGNNEALRRALDLYHTIQKNCHDARNDGWFEHHERNWKLIDKQDPRIEVEIAGRKSANAHLHWMEALAELYDATRDDDVKKSLAEALRLNATIFYPKEVGTACFHRMPDWQPVQRDPNPGLSYGHNVEFAWLMIRAENVLKQKPSWDHFDAIMQHALKYGYDHQLGGIYNRGFDDQPATDTDKVWWSQAEMMAALTDGIRHKKNAAFSEALDKLLHFLATYQTNAADGIWLDTVTKEGKPKSTAKAHNWKANYHDVRAMVKFVEAFAPGKPAPPK